MWVGTISVNQDIIQGVIYSQTILSGMEMAVLSPVHVAHSTILHISLSNSPALPLMIEARLCYKYGDGSSIEFIEFYVQCTSDYRTVNMLYFRVVA